jgi:hypothetical protein
MRNAFLLFLFCVLAGLGLLVLSSSPRHPMTLGEVKTKIDAQVPLGSDRKVVEAWLRAHHFKFQYIQGQENFMEAFIRRSGHQAKELDGYLYTHLSDTRRGLMSYYTIYIDFFFDKNQKFISYSMREQKASH